MENWLVRKYSSVWVKIRQLKIGEIREIERKEKYANGIFLILSRDSTRRIGHIEANPLLKGDHTKGVLLGEFPLKYKAFDNSVASGKSSTPPFNRLKKFCYKSF